MANYYTHFAFQIPASQVDAERFVAVVEAADALATQTRHQLGPEISGAFCSDDQSPEEVFAGLMEDWPLGIESHFDAEQQKLTICDSDGGPYLWALAQFTQRLYPDKLPLGFVYSETCDKCRTDGFGGGLFAIGRNTIVHRNLAEMLDDELAELREHPDET